MVKVYKPRTAKKLVITCFFFLGCLVASFFFLALAPSSELRTVFTAVVGLFTVLVIVMIIIWAAYEDRRWQAVFERILNLYSKKR